MRPGSCDSRSGDGGYRVAVLFNGCTHDVPTFRRHERKCIDGRCSIYFQCTTIIFFITGFWASMYAAII